MYGIAGIVELGCSESTLISIQEKCGGLAYRSCNHCTLLWSESSGSQMMTLDLEGEHFTILFDGELYNASELRRKLQAQGHTFFSDWDCEIILRSYIQQAEDSLLDFNGAFSFAIWSENQKGLFVARDRMGVKPLFYKLHNDGLLFATELATILAYPSVIPHLRKEGIAELLLLGPGRKPGSGILEGIQELEPGWYGTFNQGQWEKKQYWKLTDGEHRDSFSDTCDHVRQLVIDSISRQITLDQAVGTFLSGGLDSSIISAVCSYKLHTAGIQLNTFSVDYAGNDRYFSPGKFQPSSDDHYIQIMSQSIGSIHHKTVLTPMELAQALNEAVIAREFPGMGDVDSSLLLFCRQTGNIVPTALSGECADEIFGGYPWYRDPAIRAVAGFPWAQNTARRLAFLSPDIREGIDGEEFVRECYNETIRQTDILPDASPEERRMKEMVNLNQQWFMQTLMVRNDRMSRRAGLKVRTPFCDYRIAEYLYRVPWDFKDYKGREKGLLRAAFQDLLPEEVLYRKKSPYPKTYDPNYLTIVSKMLQDVMNDPSQPIHAIVDSAALRSLLSDNDPQPWYGQLMRAPQVIAYMLQINFWMNHFKITVA